MPVIKRGSETQLLDIEWCWKPYIPYGKVSQVVGSGGDGKTTLILTVAAMLSQGIAPPSLERGHLIPSQPCEPIRIFYLTNEDEVADSSLKRFYRAGGNGDMLYYSGELQEHMTLTRESLLEVIQESGCRLMIVDPIQAFLPEGVHMSNSAKMRPLMTMLSNVAKETGVAIVLVGHLNKNESSKLINQVGGTADLAASVRSILLVESSKRDREMRWVKAIKSNFDESDYTPIRLVMDEERRLSFKEMDEAGEDDEEEEEAPKTKIELAMEILTDLLADGPHPVAEINAACAEEGIGDKTAQRARKRLGAVPDYINGVPVWKLE